MSGGPEHRSASPADEPTRMPYLLLALAVLAADQWSKWAVERHLAPGASTPVIPGLLDLTHVRNTGVAFGLLPAGGDTLRTLGLVGLGLLSLGVVLWIFRRTPVADRLLLTALGLILGGAVGNLLDRLAAGAVTDFIDFYVGGWHWHTFNVADSAITVGIACMLLEMVRPREPQTRAERDEAREPESRVEDAAPPSA